MWKIPVVDLCSLIPGSPNPYILLLISHTFMSMKCLFKATLHERNCLISFLEVLHARTYVVFSAASWPSEGTTEEGSRTMISLILGSAQIIRGVKGLRNSQVTLCKALAMELTLGFWIYLLALLNWLYYVETSNMLNLFKKHENDDRTKNANRACSITMLWSDIHKNTLNFDFCKAILFLQRSFIVLVVVLWNDTVYICRKYSWTYMYWTLMLS